MIYSWGCGASCCSRLKLVEINSGFLPSPSSISKEPLDLSLSGVGLYWEGGFTFRLLRVVCICLGQGEASDSGWLKPGSSCSREESSSEATTWSKFF